jgi:hypothetical protein
MANPQKRKGSAFERLIADYLAERIPCERIPAGATLDRGDLWTATAAIQCKNHRTLSLGAWLDATQQQQHHAAKPFHALVVKRKGTTDPAQQFVVMTLEQFRDLLAYHQPGMSPG